MSKAVLITGCANPLGAGAALAREFHSRGWQVFATCRSSSPVGPPSKLEFLSEIGIETLALDVTSSSSIAAAVSIVRQKTGGNLDLLVNNAALYGLKPVADVRLDEARNMFETNFFGVLAVTQAFLPLLMHSPELSGSQRKAEERGMVVNISSISAWLCPPFQGIYASSKAALNALGHTMRIEFKPLGIKVVTVASGGVDTGQQEIHTLDIPKGSLYKGAGNKDGDFKGIDAALYAKEVVDVLLRARGPPPIVWKGAFAWITWILTWFGVVGMMDQGQINRGGLTRIMPARNDSRADKQRNE